VRTVNEIGIVKQYDKIRPVRVNGSKRFTIDFQIVNTFDIYLSLESRFLIRIVCFLYKERQQPALKTED